MSNFCIQYAKHYKNYLKIRKDMFYVKNKTDKHLSLQARGLLVTLLALPKDWEVSVLGLAELCSCSPAKIENTLKELKDFQFLFTKKIRAGSLYLICETNIPKNWDIDASSNVDIKNKFLDQYIKICGPDTNISETPEVIKTKSTNEFETNNVNEPDPVNILAGGSIDFERNDIFFEQFDKKILKGTENKSTNEFDPPTNEQNNLSKLENVKTLQNQLEQVFPLILENPDVKICGPECEKTLQNQLEQVFEGDLKNQGLKFNNVGFYNSDFQRLINIHINKEYKQTFQFASSVFSKLNMNQIWNVGKPLDGHLTSNNQNRLFEILDQSNSLEKIDQLDQLTQLTSVNKNSKELNKAFTFLNNSSNLTESKQERELNPKESTESNEDNDIQPFEIVVDYNCDEIVKRLKNELNITTENDKKVKNKKAEKKEKKMNRPKVVKKPKGIRKEPEPQVQVSEIMEDIPNAKLMKNVTDVENAQARLQQQINKMKEETELLKQRQGKIAGNKKRVLKYIDKTYNSDMAKALKDFVDVYIGRRGTLTLSTFKQLIQDLNAISQDPKEQLDIINQSIKRSYLEFYPISKSNSKDTSNKNKGGLISNKNKYIPEKPRTLKNDFNTSNQNEEDDDKNPTVNLGDLMDRFKK